MTRSYKYQILTRLLEKEFCRFIPIKKDVDIGKIAELTEGYSGADVSSVVNTALSLVLHDHIQKYPSPDEALKHTSEALVSMRHFEDAIKKVRGQREMKPEEKINLSHYK